MHKVIVVVHGIGEQEQFETLFDFSDGFHWSTRNIIKDYGEKNKNDLLELTGDDPRKPFIANAALWAAEELRKNNQPLTLTSFTNSVNARLSAVLNANLPKLKSSQTAFANKAADLFRVSQNLGELLKLNYIYKLFPRGLGIEKDGFAEVSHVNDALHLHELWWAPEVRNKPKLWEIFWWLLTTVRTTKEKPSFRFYPFMASLGLALSLLANILYLIPCLRKYIKAALVDSFGDVKVYVTDDVECKRIQGQLERKIKDLSGDEEAEEIWLVGHSLGSVISFDVLKKFIDNNVKTKVTRFYSVGSPLDKINYFWGGNYGANVVDLLQKNGIEWYNYYASLDIVSDYLCSFGKLTEQEKFYNSLSILTAHTTYWRNNSVMENVVRDVYVRDPIFQETPGEKAKRKEKVRKQLARSRVFVFLNFIFWIIAIIAVFKVCAFILGFAFHPVIKFIISLIK